MTVLVSHRLATARSADTMLVMEAGTIVDRGTLDGLMQRPGTYRELFTLQAAAYS